jgi:16S rRNA processing protein RimM
VTVPPEWLLAGRVGRPHGLDGSFHVTQPNPQLLAAAASLVVDDRELDIIRRAGTEKRVILRLRDHEDREAAEALRGKDLLIPRATAPELGPDEWWAEDLAGCAVHDADREVGTVRRLVELPSCEMLEVERSGGGELLVPLVADAVREVDLERRAIDIDLEFLGEA